MNYKYDEEFGKWMTEDELFSVKCLSVDKLREACARVYTPDLSSMIEENVMLQVEENVRLQVEVNGWMKGDFCICEVN